MHTSSNNGDAKTNAQSSTLVAGPAARYAANSGSPGASREVHDFLADIEDLIRETTSLTGEDLAQAQAKLRARVVAAKESLEAVGNSIAQQARQTATVTNDYVHQQPWKVLAACTSVAFLLGLIVARRG